MSYEKDPELKIPDRTPSADIDATAIDSASHEAMASPEEISATHSKLKTLIMSVPDEYIWNFSPKRGPGDSQDNIPHLRLMSLPTETREDGSMRGESFVWISYFDKESLDDSAEIKVTIDHGSGNPWGDVLNNAGVKVDKIRRKEITFGPEGQSRTRHGRFTFGPAELERKENEAQVNNPWELTTDENLSWLKDALEKGSIHSHDGSGEYLNEDYTTMQISEIVDQGIVNE